MATVNMHTGIYMGAKFEPLSDAAFRLWVHGVCWSKEQLTDGFIPVGTVAKLHPKGARVVAELLATHIPGKGPLWHAVQGGFQIHDFGDWQDSAEEVQTRRLKWREQKKRPKSAKPSPSVPAAPVESRPASAVESIAETPADSIAESATESATESERDSRAASRHGSGSGGGGGTDRKILESPDGDSTARGARESSPPVVEWSAFDRRNAALELCEAWRAATGQAVDASKLSPADLRRFGAALTQRDLAAWRGVFAAVAASDYLSGRDGQHSPVTLWRALDLAARIESGEFADRPKAPPKVAGLRAGGVPVTAAASRSVCDPETGYRFVCDHSPTCATWPGHRDRVNAETPREVSA